MKMNVKDLIDKLEELPLYMDVYFPTEYGDQPLTEDNLVVVKTEIEDYLVIG